MIRLTDSSGDAVDGPEMTLIAIDGVPHVHNGFHAYPIAPGPVTIEAL